LNIRLYALNSYGRANRVPPPDILFPSETLLQGHYSGHRRFVLKPEFLARVEGAHEPSNVGFQFEVGHISLDSRCVVDEQRSYFEQAVTSSPVTSGRSDHSPALGSPRQQQRDNREQRPHTAEAEEQHPAEPSAIRLPTQLPLQEVQLVQDGRRNRLVLGRLGSTYLLPMFSKCSKGRRVHYQCGRIRCP
jgi:hypothetical protein